MRMTVEEIERKMERSIHPVVEASIDEVQWLITEVKRLQASHDTMTVDCQIQGCREKSCHELLDKQEAEVKRLWDEAQFPSWDVRRTWGRGEVCESCSHDLCTRIRKQDTTIATLREECDVWKEQYERQWGRMNDAIATLRATLNENTEIRIACAKTIDTLREALEAYRDDCSKWIKVARGIIVGVHECNLCKQADKALGTEGKGVHQE